MPCRDRDGRRSQAEVLIGERGPTLAIGSTVAVLDPMDAGRLRAALREAIEPPSAALAALRHELIERAAADQHARAQLDPAGPTPHQWAAVQRVDEDNLHWLAPIVAVHAAWILAQHAPARYRACWLPKLRDAVACGDASPRDLAYLSDRVATDEKRGQRYGTQWLHLGGVSRLYPLHRPAEVNLARADVGLDLLPDADLDTAYASFEEITAAVEGAPS
ncbi:DUF6624 domain-containing protein [Amycolatopsis plumensis]|uniref:DUF6624 domain-containing protein n=1 Tax=Amycolatopsis plumensis TaxID=236508 RepID=A0ABV5U4J8_9PSEU